MPKGEHLKKENPKNYVLSFKVNRQEMQALKKLAKESGLSMSEYMRLKSLKYIDKKLI